MKAKKRVTWLWGFPLVLVLLVGLLSTTALAADATADFTTDPTAAITALGGDSVASWDGGTKTLTLNGVNFETTAIDAVHLPGGTTIVLTGVNTITGGPAVASVNGGWCCGIRVEGDLTISGTGSLTVTGGDASATYGVSAGIFSHVNYQEQGSTVRITGGTVEAMGGPAREKSYGILAGWTGYGDVVISGTANVTAKGGDMVQDNISYGIYAKPHRNNVNAKGGYVTISDDAHVTAIGGDKGLWGNGITSRSVTISGNAQVRAESGEAGDNVGICASDRVTISGNAQVTAIGKDGHYSAGISGAAAPTGEVNISDTAQVTATGGNAGDQSYGIYVYNLNISGGTVIAKAGVVTYAPGHYWTYSSGNAGIYSAEEVNISGSAQVTAMAAPVYGKEGNVDETDSRGGINRPINFSGGIVTAAGYKNDCSATFQNDGGYKNSFNANGGTGLMSFTKATAGEYASYTLPANGFIAPVGMKFKAWEVGGVQMDVGDTITIGETTAVKALWEYINYDVDVTNGTASAAGNTITTAVIDTEVTLTAAEIDGKVFDHWVVESGGVTLADANSATTTFTMPAGDVSVTAVYLDAISSVAITDITAPVSNTALDTTAACATTGVSTTAPTVTWKPSATNADYGTAYTASVTLTAGTGYVFADADKVAATVNGETATATKNEDGTLTVTYAFPKTADKILIPSVAITGVTAPVPGAYFVWTASCETTGVSSPYLVWDPNDRPAQYGKTYTAKVSVWADSDHKFDGSTTATINGNPAVITGWSEGSLGVSYSFTTAKHDIQICFDNTVSDGDPVVAPTINDGYRFSGWMFYEDTNKDDNFTNDLSTIVVTDEILQDAAEDEGMTPEEFIADYYTKYKVTIKTTFTGGYQYGLYVSIARSDGQDFAEVSDQSVTDATVTVNGADVTAQCTSDGYIKMMPEVCFFTAANADRTLSSIAITTPPSKTTYTVGESFDTAGMVVKATYSDGSTATVTDYTVSPSAALTTSNNSVTISYTEGGVTQTATQTITVNPAAPTGGGIYIPPTYKVESQVTEDTDGSVSFSKNSAKKGDTVAITVTPDRYYKTSGVIVKDASGRMIAVTDNGNGTFTFQMPDSKVTVEPVFSWDNPFVDVAGDAYYAPAVEWALKNEVTDGTSDTTFSPDAGCTRGQIVTFLWRAAGCPEPAGMSSFTDVSADAYYAKAVAWAVEQGITDGTGGGKFSPDAVCTRGQIVTFLWRAEKSPAVGTANPFTDVEADAYYAGATNWAVENGITEGTGDGTTFSPANDCTRAQIVTFLYRFFVK